MKLNLGCGDDVKPGYVNVDRRERDGVVVADLSKFPWPFADGSATEILLYDFLEHFPYRSTAVILSEVWRVLALGGHVEIQVPDLDHCSRAACHRSPFLCNRCGNLFKDNDETCTLCKQSWYDVAEAAVRRLYGGQDYEGNWHFTAFGEKKLTELLLSSGFEEVTSLEQQHQYANWNIKLRSKKKDDLWGVTP